jgi:hypothetical protein
MRFSTRWTNKENLCGIPDRLYGPCRDIWRKGQNTLLQLTQPVWQQIKQRTERSSLIVTSTTVLYGLQPQAAPLCSVPGNESEKTLVYCSYVQYHIVARGSASRLYRC